LQTLERDRFYKVRSASSLCNTNAPNNPPHNVLEIAVGSLVDFVEQRGITGDHFAYIPSGQCSLQIGTTCGDQEWGLSARTEALKTTLDLFNTAKSLGVTVFFVTGRADRFDLRAATVKNLKEAGYDGWQDLIMRPISSAGPVADYKSSARKAIQDEKYHIILNVGDQQSDLDGGFADQTFRVPNPFISFLSRIRGRSLGANEYNRHLAGTIGGRRSGGPRGYHHQHDLPQLCHRPGRAAVSAVSFTERDSHGFYFGSKTVRAAGS
jgi:HAD superfamily, subfamily IIIB (Acid phosphatase)